MVLYIYVDDSREWSPHIDTMYIDPYAPNSKSIVLEPIRSS